MRIAAAIGLTFAAWAAAAFGGDDPVDRVEDALAVSGWNNALRLQLSGTLDLEDYHFQAAPQGLIFSDDANLFVPRLTLYLDAQAGKHIYVFVESRADRGFDPGYGRAQVRLDEYAVRFTPWSDGSFNLQVGKFATFVGNWTPRHGSWDDPFITAPLPYDNLTGFWDSNPARSPGELLTWAGVRPAPVVGGSLLDRNRSLPVIWGPSYASGAAAFGGFGPFDYAVEVKNASLSSRPDAWDSTGPQWAHPTVSARFGFQPGEAWSFGLSASDGPYLQTLAMPAPGHGLGDYREIVFGQDAAYAWHHLQLWGELYEARFTDPEVSGAETTAYYVEAKYKFTPQFFGAIRWNQQLFSSVPLGGGQSAPWGRDVWRIDVGPGYRFTPHMQLKVQYSLQREDADVRPYDAMVAAQFTIRF